MFHKLLYRFGLWLKKLTEDAEYEALFVNAKNVHELRVSKRGALWREKKK